MIKSQVMVFSHGRVVMYIKEIMRMIQGMDMVKCTGWTVVFTKGIGGMGFSMEKAKYMYLDKE